MSIVTKRVQAPQFYYYKHAQKNFWAHIDTPCLGPNKNSFRSLFESKYNHFLFFRASVYDRSIKQFILQSVSVCETPLDYFSMLWSSGVDLPTNFFVQRFAASLHHNSTGQQQLNYSSWLPGTISNFHKIRAAALQSRSDFRLLSVMRRFESARLGGGNSLPLVFRDLNVLPDPTYLFFLSKRSTFNEIKNLRVPTASLQNVLSGFNPFIFGRVRPVLQLPFSSGYNNYLRFVHFSLFRDASIRSWKQVWLRHRALTNFLSFKQTASYLRRYFLVAHTRSLSRFGFRHSVPKSFYNLRWLNDSSKNLKQRFSFSPVFSGNFKKGVVTGFNKKFLRSFLRRRYCGYYTSCIPFISFRRSLRKNYVGCFFPSFFFVGRWFLPQFNVVRRSFSKKARKKKRIKRLSKISLPIFFANNVRFLGFTTTSRSYRFSRPKWLARLSFRSALKNNKKIPMPFANGVFKPHASTFDRNFTNFSYSNNRFFRLFSFRFNRFSKFRRSRRFYRKRWSLISRFGSNTYRFLSSARSNFFFDKKIISTKMGYFPTRFFFGSSRFALTQYLRVSRSQKFRVLKFLRKFSIDREHPVLRLGSRRHFNRFVYNHTSSLFPYLVTGNSSVHVNHLDLKVRRILPTVSSKPVFGQDFLTPNISSIHAFRFLWFKRLLFSDLLRSGWCADQDMGSKRPLFFNANSTDLDSWSNRWPWFFSSSWSLPISLVPSFPPLPPNYFIQPRLPLRVNSRFTLHQLRRSKTSHYSYFRMVRNMQRIRNPGVSIFNLYRFSNSFASRRFIVSLSRFFYSKFPCPIFWAGFSFPTYFRPFLRSRFDYRYTMFKKIPFLRRKRLIRRWRRFRSFLRRHRWKPVSYNLFPSSFYKVFFKLLSCPTIDGGTRIFLRRRSRRKQYRAKVFLRSRIQRTVNFLRHRSYNSFYSRYFRFRKLGLRKRYRHFFFGTRFFFQPPLDLHLFLEKAPLRRWWLRRVKGRFSSRLFKRRGKGLLLSRFNTKHSRYSFKTRQICFRRRSSKKSRGFLRRYRLFRFSGFMFPKISFITHRFKRHSAMLKLRFFRSLLKTRRLATSRFFYLGYKRLFLYKLLYFLKKRRRRLMRRRLRSRRYRFDRVLRRFSTFSFFGLRRKKRRHIWFRRRSRFLFVQVPCKPTLKVLKVKKFQPKVSFFSFPQFRAPVFFPKPPSPVPVPEIKKKKYISVRIPAALRKFSTIASHRLRPSSFLIGKKRRKFSKRSFLLRFKFRPRPFSLKALTRRRATFPIFGLFQGRKIKNRRRSFFFRISPLYSSRSSFIFANFLRQFPFSGFCFLSYLRRFYIRSRRRIPSRFFLTSAIPIRRRRELNSVFAWRRLRFYDRWFFRRRLSQVLKYSSSSDLRSHRFRCWRRFQHSHKLLPWSLSRSFRRYS